MATTSDRTPAAVVPAVGTAGSVTTVRSLGRQGVNTICVSSSPSPPSFSSRYCGERVAVPEPEDDLDGYGDALLSLAARDDVETIVPVREADVHVLATRRAAFAEHVRPLWPDNAGLRAIHDRHELFEAAARADVPYPATQPLDEVERWDRERIVKGRYAFLTDETGTDVESGQSAAPPKTMFLDPGEEPDIDAIVAAMGHVPIAQEFVAGTEFCYRALCVNGEVLASSGKQLRRGYKYARGPSVYHEAVDDPDLAAQGKALLAQLGFTGIASVGFIRDADGEFRLLEVNPRVPASVPMDYHAGVDYPALYFDLAVGRSVSQPESYRPGVASHLLRGELVHLHSVLREEYPLAERPSAIGTVGAIATSLVTQPRFDLLCTDDPRPFVRDTLNATRGVLGR